MKVDKTVAAAVITAVAIIIGAFISRSPDTGTTAKKHPNDNPSPTPISATNPDKSGDSKQARSFETGLLASLYLMGNTNTNLPRPQNSRDFPIKTFGDYTSKFSAGNFLFYDDLSEYDTTNYTATKWDGYISIDKPGQYIFLGNFNFSGTMYRNTKCIFDLNLGGNHIVKKTKKDQVLTEQLVVNAQKGTLPISLWINCSGGSNPGQVNEKNAFFSLKWKKPGQNILQKISRESFLHSTYSPET